MQKIRIKDIIDKFGGKLINGNPEIVIENIEIDSRIANENSVFFGVKTENANGSDYLLNALEKNVKASIVDHCDLKLVDETVVVVEDVKDVLHKITRLKRQLSPEKKVIAITGSVGKTTTKNIVSQMLSTKYRVNKTKGNYNNELGVPITFFQTYDEDISVIEMGMNHKNEISKLSNLVNPDLGVITNIGSSHIGNLGSKENIFEAKMEILDGMKQKVLVINQDDQYLNQINKLYNDVIIYNYGVENDAQIIAKDIVIDKEKTKFKICYDGNEYNLEVPLLGKIQVYNVLCAIRISLLFGISILDCINSIENFQSEQGRLNLDIAQNGIKIINDTYNASFESVLVALDYLNTFSDANSYALIGDMTEQGDYSIDLHTKVGQYFKQTKIKNAIFVGKNARYMYEGLKKSHAKTKAKYFETKEEAKQYLKDTIKPFDVVLLKASHSMGFHEFVPFLESLKFGFSKKFFK